MDRLLEELYDKEAQELRRWVYLIVSKYGGIYGKDMDDFMSVADEVIAKICKENRYDPSKGNIKAYVYRAIEYRIKDAISSKNALKRNPHDKDGNIYSVLSLDSPMGEDNSSTIGDFLCSKSDRFDIIEEVEKKNGVVWSENAEKYLNSLNEIQRKILMLRINGATVEQIMKRLDITKKRFEKELSDLKKFENISLLYQGRTFVREENDMNSCTPQTLEKSKTIQLSVYSIVNKMDKQTLRFNHPLQRESDQHSPTIKGNMMSDIIQGNPIPQLVFAEQVVNGIAIIWNLDGKQRCTNVYNFVKGQYKISKNIRRWNIEYDCQLRDENGEKMFDEMGFPMCEKRTFDIRNKKFTDLPEELRERFMDYTFEIVQYFNCTADDIAYHIARYNEGKPANVSQKGIIKLGETFASMVKSIANMPFFKDMGGYKVSEFKSGSINKVVVESVMAATYLDNWKKDMGDACEFLKENATCDTFDNFEDMVHRLENVITDDVSDMFNSKDSFMWFGLFARFIKTDVPDEKFIEFMAEFAQSLHSKELSNGTSYDAILEFHALKKGSTKEKQFIIQKLNHLERLMYDYLSMTYDENEIVEAATLHLDSDWTDFADKFSKNKVLMTMDIEPVIMDKIAVQSYMIIDGKTNLSEEAMKEYVNTYCTTDTDVDDIQLYMDMLDDYTVNLDAIYHTVHPESIPTLVGVMKYAWDNEINDDAVIVGLLKKWVNNLNTDKPDDKVKNCLLMIDDLKKENVEVA